MIKNPIKSFYLVVFLQACGNSSSKVQEPETQVQQVRSEIKYETGGNDSAEIKLTLHPDSTVSFYFKAINPPLPVVEGKGKWVALGNNIEVTFQKVKGFKYEAIFSADSSNVIVNDSTFRFDKDKKLNLWGVLCDKTVTSRK